MSTTVRFDNGDIEIDSTGGQTLVRGAEKAAQDLLHEMFLPYDVTEDRGNELFLPSGDLAAITGAIEINVATIRSFIREAVGRLQEAQRRNPNADRSELIQQVTSLVVRPKDNDVTRYAFFLSVLVDDEEIAVARVIRTGHLGDTTRPLVGGYDPF